MRSKRNGVYVEMSKLVVSERGLYCSAPLKRGDFIGFYDGAILSQAPLDDAFCMVLGDMFIDGNRDGLPCANEACLRAQQNAAYASYFLFAAGDRTPVAEAIGLWAVRAIPAHQEILTHYGEHYASRRQQLGYTVESPKRVSVAQDPRDAIGTLPLSLFASLGGGSGFAGDA